MVTVLTPTSGRLQKSAPNIREADVGCRQSRRIGRQCNQLQWNFPVRAGLPPGVGRDRGSSKG
jgi:hypothetical protein